MAPVPGGKGRQAGFVREDPGALQDLTKDMVCEDLQLEADRRRLRRRPAGRNPHYQRGGRGLMLEAIGLGGAGIPGGGADLPLIVPVAQAQVIQPHALLAIRRDG